MTNFPRKDSKFERYHVETHITYAPCSSSSAEEDAGSPNDLFACPETGDFFTVAVMDVQFSSGRSASTSSKAFQCPVCVSAPLTIRPSSQRRADEALAICMACGWDTSKCGVADIGDLVQRVLMPYPWLESHFRALVKASNSNTSGKNMSVNGNSTTSSSAAVAAAAASRRRRIAALTQKPVIDSIAFSEKQDAHERKIFQEFIPPPVVVSTSDTHAFADDSDNMEEIFGDIDVKDLMEGKERKATGIWFRKQGGPLQRVRAPHVSVKNIESGGVATTRWDLAMYNGGDPEYSAAYILPRVMINMKGCSLCSSKSTSSSSSSSSSSPNGRGNNNDGSPLSTQGKVDLLLSIRNERQLAATVRVFNCADRSQTGEIWLAPGELCMTKMKSLEYTDRPVQNWPWLEGFCDRVVQLELQVKYDMKRGSSTSGQSTLDKWQRLCRQTWRACLFVRHSTRTFE